MRNGNMVIGDEMLTPDSSVSGRQKAMNQDMVSHPFDKQFAP